MPHPPDSDARAPGSARAIPIRPRWLVETPEAPTGHDHGPMGENWLRLVMAPGPGFGDGAHPTTQLCLQALAALAPRHGGPWRMLDFGSGSGILAIAAAKLGAMVEAVEIDEHAIAHARANYALNGVSDRIRVSRGLAEATGPFDLVIANILRSVLLAFADELTRAAGPHGAIVIAGLVATEVPEVAVRYATGLAGRRPEVHALGDWRAMAWRPVAQGGA